MFDDEKLQAWTQALDKMCAALSSPDHDEEIDFLPMTPEYAELVRQWRNQDMRPWRTPYQLTEEMQQDWYHTTLCNRESRSRHWAMLVEGEFVGVVALSGIQWENGIAEIGLTMDPERSGQGYGTKAVEFVLDQAWNYLGLKTVYGECYECNPALGFWQKVCERYGAYTTSLPDRKFYGGKHWDAMYFSFANKEDSDMIEYIHDVPMGAVASVPNAMSQTQHDELTARIQAWSKQALGREIPVLILDERIELRLIGG